MNAGARWLSLRKPQMRIHSANSKKSTMKLSPRYKILIAAALGLAFSALTAHAQLMVNLSEQGTFGPFIGGTNNNVTNNGATNTSELITTGTPIASPFNITFNPLTGPSTVTLNTGTLDTANFVFRSPITPLSYFTSLGVVVNYDFNNDGIIDLTQDYTINLTPFTAPNGLTGVSYQIIPVQFFGSVNLGGNVYGYASVVANSVGTLFDGSSTTALIQFQFLATPVPEPSTYALAGVLALGGIVLLRRRRSQVGAASLGA
jgi:hypothetical protein